MPLKFEAQLNRQLVDRLLSARREIATHLALPPGEDLGFSATESELRFMPGWKRYDGNLYRAAQLSERCTLVTSLAILIVSALYGVLSAEDPIRDYELSLSDSGPSGMRMETWWRRQRLGEIVAEAALSFQPSTVHDLLSGAYRRALAPWPPPCLGGVIHQYQFPGLGIGADHARGRLLGTLLGSPAPAQSLGRFSRTQLIDRDYNSLEDPAGLDQVDLGRRYGQGERKVSLDHAAAVRGILVKDGKQWKWIWDWGMLHDEIMRAHGYERLYVRYRNQYSFLPTIEFEGPAVVEPLQMLVRDTPILPDDNIQIVGWNNFRAFSIRDALKQLGESLGR